MLEEIFKKPPAFIPYLMAGDPDVETTALLIRAVTQAGADAIELGVPYSDPLADGPSISAAGTRALSQGTRLTDVLHIVEGAAAKSPPILLFTYYNPVLQCGVERFARDAAQAGVAGAIVPDLALEESTVLRAALEAEGLAMPLLVAPSTGRERAARIAEASSGFIYVVSRLGVTGAGNAPTFAPLRTQVSMLRNLTQKPLAVGFGISTPEHVRAVCDIVDGIIVGSAIVDAYEGSRGEEAAARVDGFCRTLLR